MTVHQGSRPGRDWRGFRRQGLEYSQSWSPLRSSGKSDQLHRRPWQEMVSMGMWSCSMRIWPRENRFWRRPRPRNAGCFLLGVLFCGARLNAEKNLLFVTFGRQCKGRRWLVISTSPSGISGRTVPRSTEPAAVRRTPKVRGSPIGEDRDCAHRVEISTGGVISRDDSARQPPESVHLKGDGAVARSGSTCQPQARTRRRAAAEPRACRAAPDLRRETDPVLAGAISQ